MIEPVTVLGQPAMRLVSPDGAQAIVLLHGAHIVSWIPAGDEERLYLSPEAVAGPGQAVRGGIPVCFPQFAARGPLPRHGFARTLAWQWAEGAERGGAAIGVLKLASSEATRALWPHDFEAELTLVVAGKQLDVELAVTNTGTSAFEFTTALHTYLRIDDLLKARLHGVHDLVYDDMVNDGERCHQEFDPIGFVGEIDRVYCEVKHPFELASALGRLHIDQEGLPDTVVWNPGPDKAAELADLPDEDWQRFLCVEAAAIDTPVLLAPGAEWAGRQGLLA